MKKRQLGLQDLRIGTKWLVVHRGRKGEIIVQCTRSGAKKLPEFWTTWLKLALDALVESGEAKQLTEYVDSVHLLLEKHTKKVMAKIEQAVGAIYPIAPALEPDTEQRLSPYERAWKLSDDVSVPLEDVDKLIDSMQNAIAFYDITRVRGVGKTVIINMVVRQKERASGGGVRLQKAWPSEAEARRCARLVELRFAQAAATATARA